MPATAAKKNRLSLVPPPVKKPRATPEVSRSIPRVDLQPAAATSPHTETWLLGQPPLSRLLEFAEDTLPEGAVLQRAALTDAWRRGNDQYQKLQRTQAGIANKGSHRPLDPVFEPWAEEVRAHASFRNGFDTLPTGFEMVDLEHLIVCQMHVTQSFVDRICERVGPKPSPRALFDLCAPLEAPHAPVEIRKVGSKRYVFRCDSTDFRFHDPALLTPEQASGYESFGAIAGIVGLVVGFGANFLNAVRVGKRVMLNNGHHRAVALRALGLRYVPCVVQTATRVDELATTVKSRVAENAEFYFESARPPLLKDFFDPKIRMEMPIRKRVRQIEINFEVRDFLVAE